MADEATKEALEEISNEFILERLQSLERAGALDYVLPSLPLGEIWVIGYKDEIITFHSKAEIGMFLIGASVVSLWYAERYLPQT